MTRAFQSVCLLFSDRSGANLGFLGSCFAFRRQHWFLTARHCIGTLGSAEIKLVLPPNDYTPGIMPIEEVVSHESADVALFRVRPFREGVLLPFDGISALADWGEPVMALGYPEESTDTGPVPSARLLAGTIQRIVTYDSPLRYRYKSGELSFCAPAGLSGSPVFPTREVNRVLGVVTENRDSTTYLRAVEEVQEDGELYRNHYHEVIRYGVYADLGALAPWIDETCARFAAT